MSLLTQAQKHQVLRDMPELEMHKKLKAMFDIIYPEKQIYIGQGTGEFGKDLVLIQNDALSGERVTALVVKMGDLSGSASNGMIGTINTQITQAFAVETYFNEIGRSVKADEVIVVIFGRISQNAEKTLNGYLTINQLKAHVKTRNIDEMTQLFETHYPEVFITTSHMEALEKKHKKLTDVMLQKNRHLAHCYIEPNLQSFENSRKNMILAQNQDRISSEKIKETIFGKKDTIASIYEKALHTKTHMLLQGDAGCGKSIFTIKIVQHAIETLIKSADPSSGQNNVKAPILLKATRLKNLTHAILEQHISRYWDDDNLNIMPSMIIVDGIDEVSDIDRKSIVDITQNYCDIERISFIVTSRKNQDIVKELNNYKLYEILPFELSQAMEFIKRMAGSNQALVSSLLKNIQELQHQIPMSAMSLALLIEIAEIHNEIPASITDLYDRYVALVTGFNNDDKEIRQLFEPRFKIDFLITVSYDLFYKHDDAVVSREAFCEYLDQYVRGHSHITSKEDFLSEIQRISILSINDDSVTFSHKSFLDYFIAKYYLMHAEELFRRDEFDTLYAFYYTTLWGDVTSFYFGAKNTITKDQIDRLIAHNPYKGDNDLLYLLGYYSIGKLLQYAWNTDSSIKKYGIEKAIEHMYELRGEMDKFNQKNFGVGVPKIFADAALLHYTDFFFSSAFLIKEIVELATEKLALLADSNGNADLTNEIYFLSLFYLINSKKLESDTVVDFVGRLVDMSAYVAPKTYYPVAHLFKIFIDNGSVHVSEERRAQIVASVKTFKRKHKEIFEDNCLFRSRVERRKYKSLIGTHNK